MSGQSSEGPPPVWRPAVLLAVGVAAVLVLAYAALPLLRAEVLFDAESEYGRVRVVETPDGVRSLYTGSGRARQSAVIPGRPEHLESLYARVATVGLALIPADARILYVGLGGGAMPMHAHQAMPDARIEVVEIDPLIVDVARTYFGVRPDSNLVVHTGDGRAFIERAPAGSYDLIVLDAFSDDEIPFALTTLEFLQAVRRALAPTGIVVSNLWSSSAEYDSMLATYDAVFEDVDLVRVGRTVQRIAIGSQAARPLDRETLLQASRALQRRVELGFDLPQLVESGHQEAPEPNAPVLRDDRPFAAAS